MHRKVLGWVVIGAMLFVASVIVGFVSFVHPDGVDGDLVNGWAQPAEPKVNVPKVPSCYVLAEGATVLGPSPTQQRDCSAEHQFEAFEVGQFTGAVAAAADPPAVGGAERKAAYAACVAAARKYLGDDWRVGRLDLSLEVPSAAQWSGGARWYRCDLAEALGTNPITRSGSLRNALSGDRPVALGCRKASSQSDAFTLAEPIDCTAQHEVEFAGIFELPDGPYLDDGKRRTTRSDGCKSVVAAFAGIANDAKVNTRTAWLFTDVTSAEWALGERGVRCYIAPNKPVARSLRGAGAGALPA